MTKISTIFLIILIIIISTIHCCTNIKLLSPIEFSKISKPQIIHPFILNTKWSHLRPCSVDLDELKEFRKSLACWNSVYPENKLFEDYTEIEVALPRCYIITTASPDIYSGKTLRFNFIHGLLVQFTLGFYDFRYKTIYVVENIDSDIIYRHELQHYFLDFMEKRGGSGHDQEIWKKCEEATYSPTDESNYINKLRDLK